MKHTVISFILLSVLSYTCVTAYSSATVIDVKAHKVYQSLEKSDVDMADKIIKKAEKSKRKNYYLDRLLILLDTPTNKDPEITKHNVPGIQNSLIQIQKEHARVVRVDKEPLSDYLNREENYENATCRKWHKYKPCKDGSYFYVSYESYLDILVRIRINILGNKEDVKDIIKMEDAIEKHLALDGFSVNLLFTNSKAKDVFIVKIDKSKWTTSLNWASGHKSLAHELLHVMGLNDEYSRTANHYNNKNMSVSDRLYWFYKDIDKVFPPDADKGIMCSSDNKMLERQACEAVGLGDECVRARERIYGR